MKYSLLAPLSALAIFASIGCDSKSPKLDEANDNVNTAVSHLDAIGASQLLSSNPDIIVLDVRTPAEYADGHLPGKVVNVDFKADDFKAAAEALDRESRYLVHCRSGGRSTNSLEILKELGFKNLYHLDGGIIAWQESGESLKK